MNTPIKQCRTCRKDKPHSEFGLQTNAKDKLNPQCKLCIREDSKRRWLIHADKVNPNRQRRGNHYGQRKPMAIARERVVRVIASPRTPEEIIELTKLNEDIVSDILAWLYDANEVKVSNRRFQLVA